MTTADRFQASAGRLVRHFGDGWQVTLRRHSTLVGRVDSISIGVLQAAAASLGATTLTLSAPSLRGELIQGAQLTIPGHAAAYTTAAGCVATKECELVDVPLTSPLTAAVAAELAVTVSRAYGDETYYAEQADEETDQVSSTIDGQTRRINLVAEGGKRKPRQRDIAVSGLDARELVGLVDIFGGTPEAPFYWTVTLTNSPAAVR